MGAARSAAAGLHRIIIILLYQQTLLYAQTHTLYINRYSCFIGSFVSARARARALCLTSLYYNNNCVYDSVDFCSAPGTATLLLCIIYTWDVYLLENYRGDRCTFEETQRGMTTKHA